MIDRLQRWPRWIMKVYVTFYAFMFWNLVIKIYREESNRLVNFRYKPVFFSCTWYICDKISILGNIYTFCEYSDFLNQWNSFASIWWNGAFNAKAGRTKWVFIYLFYHSYIKYTIAVNITFCIGRFNSN
jgi:hypothetical protein